MYKNEIKIFCILSVLLILTAFYCVKNQELNKLLNRKRETLICKAVIDDLQTQFSNINFIIHKKNINNLLNTTNDIKNQIKCIAQASHIKNLFLKEENVKHDYLNIKNIKLKFSAKREHDIYDFISNLQNNFNELIIFDIIQLRKNHKYDFVAGIQCRMLSLKQYPKRSLFFASAITQKNIMNTKFIKMFPIDTILKKYSLYCVLNQTNAYINDTWVKSGAMLDRCCIKNIYQNSIDVVSNGKIMNVKLGESWFANSDD